MGENSKDDITDDEIARRRDIAIRRALNTAPSPTKKLIGATKSAIPSRTSKKAKGRVPKPKDGVTS